VSDCEIFKSCILFFIPDFFGFEDREPVLDEEEEEEEEGKK
jgi:hypothetical protein